MHCPIGHGRSQMGQDAGTLEPATLQQVSPETWQLGQPCYFLQSPLGRVKDLTHGFSGSAKHPSTVSQ